MQKIIKRLILLLILCTSIIALCHYFVVSFPTWSDVSIQDGDLQQTLPRDDANTIKAIFRGKVYDVLGDGAGCPFSKQLSITIGNKVFALSQDGCHTVLELNSGKDFALSDRQWSIIRMIFQSYNMKIPQ